MAAQVPTDKVKDKEYSNWLKVTLALYYMKSGLHTFIQNEVNCLHQSLVLKIYGSQAVPLPPCTTCNAHLVRRNKYNGIWTFKEVCKSYCDVWLNKLLALHTNPKSDKIYWNNSNVTQWPFNPWDCAKVFMPRGQPPSNVGPAQCDAQALLTMLANCTHFHQKLSPQGLKLTHAISVIRNKVIHDGEMKLSDADRLTYIKQIVQLLEDPDSLKSIEDCKTAVGNIQKIDNDSLDVLFNMDIEITGLWSAVNDFRQELGLQARKSLDTADSLKDEIKQLRQQLTDVENRLDIIQRDILMKKRNKKVTPGKRRPKKDVLRRVKKTSQMQRLGRDRLRQVKTARNYTGNELLEAWPSIEEYLLEELSPEYLCTFFEEENILSAEESTTMSQLRRRQAVEMLLQSIKVKLPEAFLCLLRALNKTGQEKKIEEIQKLLTLTDDQEPKELTPNISSYTLKLELLKDGNTVHDAEMKTRGYFDRGRIVFQYDLKSECLKWEHGSVIVHLRPLKRHTKETLAFFCRHGGMKDFVLDLLKKKDIFASLPEGEMTIHIQVCCYDKESEDWQYRDITLMAEKDVLIPHDGFTVTDDLQLIRKNLLLQYGYVVEEIEPLHFQDIFVAEGIWETDYSENLKKLKRRRARAADFLNKVMDKGNTALAALVLALRKRENDNITLRLSFVPEISAQFMDEDQKDKSLIEVVQEELATNDQEHMLWSCRLTVAVRKNENVSIDDKPVVIGVKWEDQEVEQPLATVTKPEERLFEELKEAQTSLGESGFIGHFDKPVEGAKQEDKVEGKSFDVLKFKGTSLGEGFKNPTKRRKECDGLRMLKSQTEETLDTFTSLEYISTIQAEEAKKKLDEKCFVLIKGNPGEGKTMAALYLINNESYRDRRVVLRCPHEWKMVDTDWVSIVVLEDILGQFDFDPDCLQKWMLYLPRIQEHVDAGKLQVIITTRNDILLKAYSKLVSIKLFCDDASVTLSSEKLTQSEKMGILNRELQRHKKNMEQDDKEKCIANFSGFIGFPKCCSLFAEDNILFNEKSDFFKSPAQYFVENITKLKETTKFLSLAFLFCNGDIYEEYLSPETMPMSSKTLLEGLSSCLNIKDWKASIKLLKDGYDSDLKLYIVKYTSFEFRLGSIVAKPCIRFSHAVVCKAVGRVLGSYPEAIVKYGNSEFLYQKTSTEAKDTTSQNVFIPESEYGILAKRMIQDVVEKGHKESVVKHSAFKQHSFVMNLKDELHKGNKVKDFFSDKLQFYRHQDLIEGECITFLQHLLQSDRDVVISIHSEFYEFLACMHRNNRTDCWQCIEKQNLLELALYYHHFEIADKLIDRNACYTYSSLCNAARHGDLSRVQSILEILKCSRVFSPVCGVAKDALCRAYISRNQDVIEFFLKEGITLDERHLIYVVKQGKVNDLMSVIEHLKCHNKWNPHLEKYWRHKYFFSPSRYSGKGEPHEVGIPPYSIALYIAYCKEKFDMVCQFVEQGAIVSMEMLPGVLRYSSKESVSRLIQTLKDRCIWHSNHCDAIAALQIGYTQQKYDVCDLIIQSGVSLTMESVPDVIVHQRAPFAKKVIQHLKNTNSWEPNCHYASEALGNAFSQGAYDVCDLLVEEGVSIIMKHLPLVILRPFEYVKMALTKLKDSACWDPKCDYAAIALEHAYSERKYDVCDLFMRKGVSLTMKNLPDAVCHYKASFNSVQKVIEHLKNTESWDPESVYAAEALQHAYRRCMCDVCDQLIHEGVPLTMKTLPFIASLDCMEKAIQHLKDTASWDPKCDYASRALQYACRYHNDVCILLVQHGVSLTMENLPDLICNKEASIQSVKEAIKHLKNATIWDPKCDDASEAFKYAYIKQKYDVCDVLTQERVSLTMKNLPTVVWVHIRSVDKAIEYLKYTGNWDPRCEDASKSLHYAYVKERYDVCDLLEREGVSLTMKNLSCKSKSYPSFVSVKKTIQHLQNTGNWDPKCDHASEALAMAYAQEKYDVCILLVQEGVSLKMNNVTLLAQLKNASFVSIHKAIQHIKDTGNWDPKSIHASNALECAYYKQAYGVCDMLVEEGVLLTMKILPYVILEVETSTEPVKKVIKQLQDSANWDPKSDYASLALAKAYATKKNGVCDLLLQEGITLTMKNIHNVVCEYTASVESVQKTIQHLKEVNKWDPKYFDASEALENNYIKENYDVCDLLIQEGLSLTMKNLPSIICNCKESIDLFMKVAQLLNDTVSWDPCDNASVSLANTYVEEKHDVHSMDAGETESLRMKNLHRVVCIDKTSVESVKKIIQHLKDTGNWDQKGDHASEALVRAYAHEKYDVCDLLIQEGVMITMKNLVSIVLHYETSVDSVKKAIKNLKDFDNSDNVYNWDPKCDNAAVALGINYVQENYDVCDLLVQEGSSLTMKILHKVTQKNKPSEHDDRSRALINAYVKEKYKVSDMFLQEGVSLTMMNIDFVCEKDKASFESFKKTIQYLKDTGNWTPMCHHASVALGTAYFQGKFHVCDLLVHEGVCLTMMNLPNLLMLVETSFASFKKTIQHLKDTDNWDPECDHASRTLAIAYVKEKYDVCAVLVQEGVSIMQAINCAAQIHKNPFETNEGVSLTMRDFLSIVVQQDEIYVESVKKTIQHLKDTDNWDPKCDKILVILATAYADKKYDMCAALVQEGVSLTMKELPIVVQHKQTSFQSVKKTIQHLKETDNWDPKCNNASLSLAIAYFRSKHDVCDLLIQEGVSLTMRDLCIVVQQLETSVQSVQKTIQHLKDTNNWDSKCDNASVGLAIAYIQQKFDVCDLLIQNGVSLTMRNLQTVVEHDKTSFKSIKKTIQQLKDTDNWDPKCDIASVGLAIAYIQEKYDVCDLLVQEGVSLTMRSLLIVVHHDKSSVESVKKIIEHLKDKDSWDTKCNEASLVLAHAYVNEKYNVCDLLIQKGVSLTMRDLPIVVQQDKTSVEPVKKTMQHLKDTDNWDPRCDNASEGLAIAYVQGKYDVCDLLIQEGVSLTMRNLQIVVEQEETSDESVKKAIKHLKDTDNWDPKCDNAYAALATAYFQEKYDVCNLFIMEGVSLTMRNLPIVIQQDKALVEPVKKIIQHLKDTDSWDPECEDASVGLAIAYIQEKYDVCELLVQEGVSLTMNNFTFVVEQDKTSIESVKKTIQHLKIINNWDPNCDNASVGLEIAYIQEKYDVCDLLVQDGVSLTMRSLLTVLQLNKTSLKSVKRTIKNLKDTDNWDPECNDASVGLAIAYIQEKYGVYELLVQEGVSLTMNNFPIVVEHETSIESVKKTIQHLKITNNWDPECNDASLGLAIAYTKEKYDVCDLLVQEGVSLTMRNLQTVVKHNKASVEPVKKTIQHLEDTDNWDPECDDASAALATAYFQEKYEVFDLLIQEGVSLTMRNLQIVVEQDETSVESVEKIIQHLKDTDNWDPECNDASLGLAIAYIKEKYDVCDLLIQEEVSLTMMNLQIVIEQDETSVESVEKIIQHLKDTDNWDPKCDNASLVLVTAYVMEKYAISDLLIQEGISLTMRNLPIVVMHHKTSVECVKRTIKHLKDIGIWDPRCHDAFNAFLIASLQIKFDVCRLLIEDGDILQRKNLFFILCIMMIDVDHFLGRYYRI